MKRFALMLALCCAPVLAHAFGLPYAVKSLETAKATTAKDASRHLLIFYTSET